MLNDYGLNPYYDLDRLPYVQNFFKNKGISTTEALIEQQKKPISDMWDGFNRFCKVQELSGKLAGDLKSFEISTTSKLSELQNAVEARVIDTDHKNDLLKTVQSC